MSPRLSSSLLWGVSDADSLQQAITGSNPLRASAAPAAPPCPARHGISELRCADRGVGGWPVGRLSLLAGPRDRQRTLAQRSIAPPAVKGRSPMSTFQAVSIPEFLSHFDARLDQLLWWCDRSP